MGDGRFKAPQDDEQTSSSIGRFEFVFHRKKRPEFSCMRTVTNGQPECPRTQLCCGHSLNGGHYKSREMQKFCPTCRAAAQSPKAQLADKALINSCTREIIGFVSSGHCSLSRGCGFGVAFCALPGVVRLLSSTSALEEPVVLVRGPSTQQSQTLWFIFRFVTNFTIA